MERKWRAAVIACGRMARAHGRAFVALPEVDLVACADIAPAAIERFGEEFGIPAEHRYLDYRQMLEAERPDLVAIVSLHNQHAEMVVATAEFKPKGILVEKPIALSLSEADTMIAACESAGIVLAVGHQRSYSPQYLAATRALESGQIGTLCSLESHGHPHSSLLVDGTHTVDLLRRYAGNAPIEWVFAQIDGREHRAAWGSPVENAAMIMMGFAGGVRALHTCGGATVGEGYQALWPPVTGPNYHHIILRGTAGEIHIDGDSPNPDRPWVRLIRDGQVSELPPVEFEGPEYLQAAHAQIVRDLIQSIETGAEHPLNARHARATLEVLMAAFESSRRRQLMPLPLQVGEDPLFAMLNEGAI